MKKFNRLKDETSPYLQLHATNPVDWYPWGEEAFMKAKEEDKPVFLSSGYSTCHWCHVMEEESFSDEEVAELLNDSFVCIKVDREERPDIDNVYMAACQLMNNSGGWPLNVFLTHEGKPFFAGTYFPKKQKGNMPGLMEMIPRIQYLWKTNREAIEKSAQDMANSLREISKAEPGELPGEKIFDRAFRKLEKHFDAQWGGFYSAPKFPMPAVLLFLSSYYESMEVDKALQMAETTLEKMSAGGIMDQLSGGFHRYSTDRQWKVPHFEKMLYDQALILAAAADIFSKTENIHIREIARLTGNFMVEHMVSPDGGFYSAMDADSPEGEGRYYLWREDELREALGEDWPLFSEIFHIEEEGNFSEESSGSPNGLNILYTRDTPDNVAGAHSLSPEEVQDRMRDWRSILLKKRNQRKAPFVDKKVLSDWNGLAISSLAYAGRVLVRTEWTDAAIRASEFILNNMKSQDNVLYHRYLDGERTVPGFLDDYAFMADALVELYRTTGTEDYLEEAEKITDVMIEKFYDAETGGFYMVDPSREVLFRPRDAYDGATVSGNGTAVKVLLNLSELTGNEDYRDRALATARFFSGRLSDIPSSHTFMLKVLMDNSF